MRNLKCTIQMMIRMMIQMTVFWTVCTPNHIAIRNLKCAIQMMVLDHHLNGAFQITHFGVHMVQTTVFRILIQNAHFELKLKLRTLLSCENSLIFADQAACIYM